MFNQNCAIEYDFESQPKLNVPLIDLSNLSSAKVLLVDDDRTTRRFVSAALQGFCELAEAADANECIDVYNSYCPDLVFMDIELPDADGKDLLHWINKIDPTGFVVMFSGHSETDNIMKSIDLGAKGFISKPFELSKMLYFIRKCRGA